MSSKFIYQQTKLRFSHRLTSVLGRVANNLIAKHVESSAKLLLDRGGRLLLLLLLLRYAENVPAVLLWWVAADIIVVCMSCGRQREQVMNLSQFGPVQLSRQSV